MGPKTKYWGSLSLDKLGKAVKEIPSKVKQDDKYGKQIYIEAAMWDDNGISISIWNKEKNETIKLGNLRVSDFQQNSAPAQAEEKEDDLPF